MNLVRKTGTLCLLLALLAAVPLSISLAGIRLNVTPSAPIGIWLMRTVSIDSLLPGEYVQICAPASAWLNDIARRARLPRGQCDTGLAPFIKKVAARAGDRYAIGPAGVSVNGQLFDRTAPLVGWPLPSPSNGIIEPGWLLMFQDEHPRSLDSRYLGPFDGHSGVMRARLLYGFGSWPSH